MPVPLQAVVRRALADRLMLVSTSLIFLLAATEDCTSYMWAMTASPNSEVLTSVAPSMSRAKS
jgi:hypothetical protein